MKKSKSLPHSAPGEMHYDDGEDAGDTATCKVQFQTFFVN